MGDQIMEFLSLMIIGALLATIAVLGAGVVGMVRGGDYNREHATQLMASRVGFQGLALVLMLFALLLANS
jgi:hypothetical protein